MSRHLFILSIAVLLSGACAQEAPEPQKTIDDAVAALGGIDRVRAVRTLVLEGEGVHGNLGQDLTPEASGQTFAVTEFRRLVDVENGRARTELTRTPRFTFFQGQAPQRQVTGVDRALGYNVAGSGTATRTSDTVSRDRRAEWHHHPITLAHATLSGDALIANPRVEGSERLVDISVGDGIMLTLALDTATQLPTRISSKTDQANLGDVTIETRFADYRDVEGVKLPVRLTTTTDGVMSADIRLASQRVNGEPLDIAAPTTVASAPPPVSPAPTVEAQEVAPGTWLLGGQSHHSVLVEFGDHLTLIEVPQSEARTLAVIARARELRPGKPLTEAVSTHHHFDHSAGLRAAVSEGLTIIAQAQSSAYYRQAVERPHTVVSDALSRNPKPVTVREVRDELTLTDGARTVVLYRVPGNAHADTMLFAYFPRERLIVEADLFTPGAAVNAFTAHFVESLRARGLRAERVVPLHGMPASFDEMIKSAAAVTR